MGELLWLIYQQPLNQIIVSILLLILGWAMLDRCLTQKLWWRLLNSVGAAVSVAAVIYMTIFRNGGEPELILRPFASFLEAKIQPEMYRSMLMNVFLFVPLGLTLYFSLPKRWKRGMITVIFACLLAVMIELIQYRLQLGRCETDDVIMNTIGGMAGVVAAALERFFLECGESDTPNEG